jgi:hypothetical protein
MLVVIDMDLCRVRSSARVTCGGQGLHQLAPGRPILEPVIVVASPNVNGSERLLGELPIL